MAKPTFTLSLDKHRTEIVRRENVAGIRVDGDVVCITWKAGGERRLDTTAENKSAVLQQLATELPHLFTPGS